MRVDQAQVGGVERLQVFLHFLLEVLELRLRKQSLPVFHLLDQHRLGLGVGARFHLEEVCLAEGMVEGVLLACDNLLALQGHQVGKRLAIGVREPVDLLDAGVGRLGGGVADLHGRDHLSIFTCLGSKFVDPVQAALEAASDQVGADAPAVDRGTALDELLDDILGQVVADGDGGVGKTCRVQLLADLLGQVGQVA